MVSGCVKRALAISLALGVCAAPAFGQGSIEFEGEGISVDLGSGPMTIVTEGGGMRSALARHAKQPVTAEELERYSAYLGLATDQAVLVREMFVEFDGRVQEINAKERQGMMDLAAELRKGRDDRETPELERAMERMRSVEEQRRALVAERDALGVEFLEDLKLVLTAEQLDRWPGLERMRKRDRHLAPGSFPGEDVDLIVVCSEFEMVFDPEQVSEGGEVALEEILGRYEVEIDRLLQQRMDIAGSHPMAEAMEASSFGWIDIDESELEDWQKRHGEAGQRLQRAQQKYVGQVARLLVLDSKAAFETRIRELSYPEVLGPSIFDRQFEAISALEDLDEEQKQKLGAMRSGYDRARARFDEAWIRAIDAELAAKDRSGAAPPSVGGVQVFVFGESTRSERGQARAARRALDQEWVKNLRALLTPEQAESVPSPPSGRHIITMPDFGGVDPETGEPIPGGVIELSVEAVPASGGGGQ